MIIIPSRFQRIISKSTDKIKSQIHTVIQRYDQILSRNGMFFFNDYTDHGVNHINQVLASCDNLISDDSIKLLTGEDIFVYVFSVIIHDIGLLLNANGFELLIDGIWDDKVLVDLDKRTWKEEWLIFLKKSYNFSSEQKLNIFGNADIPITPPDLKNLGDYDRRLIGEFIREHHPRLAHEIALYGMPYANRQDNIFSTGLDTSLCELSGLVARSHGMRIRDTYLYLQKCYGISWRNPYKVKVVFWMAVIRIADYIQIEASRAPDLLLKISSMRSPYSKMEWELHNCVCFVDTHLGDSELINIHAQPTNSIQFTKLLTLLKNIQQELDVSWAAIGENYQTKLKLKYRRISSNIFDAEEFSKSITFVPFPITFHTDPSLLKLLISPLYNNDPGMGVRELLQNSIDAVNERSYLPSKNKYSPKIVIEVIINDPDITFSIQDNGIGMSLKTLTDFYFTAGRSYRNSIEWTQLFSHDHRAEVLRSGRFGVGALATFLLGNEVNVETRSIDETFGLTFTMQAYEDVIQINKKQNLPVGTKITVKLRREVKRALIMAIDNLDYRRLKWFTYYIKDNDIIEYKINEHLIKAFSFPTQVHLTPSSLHPNEKWSYLEANDLKVFFTYNFDISSKVTTRTNGSISCNGFRIINGYSIEPRLFEWSLPELFIEDKHGTLPLSLDRNSVYNDTIPFEKELVEQIARDLIESIINVEFVRIGELRRCKSKLLKYFTAIDIVDHIVCFKDYYTFNLPFILQAVECKTIYLLMVKAGVKPNHHEIFNHDVGYQIKETFTFQNSWFSIQNTPETLKQLPKTDTLYLDEFYNRGLSKRRENVFVSHDLRRKLNEQLTKESKVVPDNNINFSTIKKKKILNRLVRNTFITETSYQSKWIEDVFKDYFNGNYRIQYK